MRREDLVYRYVLELDDKASGPWNRSAQLQAAAVAQVEEGLDRQTRAAIKHASVTTDLTGQQVAAYKEVAVAARRRDAEITRAALNSSATVSRASVREVEALRLRGFTYRQIAADHRRAGISAEQSAAMIERAAARERRAYESIATAAARTRAARQSARDTITTTLRRGAATAGIAATIGAGVAIRQTVDFDRELRNVNSIAQLSERSLQRVGDRVRDLGGRTAQAPKVIAEGMYDLVSSSFKAGESLKIVESSAKAATAGLTDTATSTGAVAAVLNAYHLRAGAAARVSDTLFQTVNVGVVTFEALAQTIGDVLPFASSLGVELTEVGAATATMTKAGISAPETMTRIKAVMTALLKPSEALAAAIRKTGVESGEALIRQKGFQGALDTLVSVTDGSKAAVAKLFPNVRALGGALALTGRNSRSANRDLAQFAKVTGATDRALAQQSRSVSYGWEKLKATASGLAIGVGQELIPEMVRLLDVGGDLTRDFFAGLSGHPMRGAVSDAYEFGAAVGQIAQAAMPLVVDIAAISRETAEFVGEHDELRQLVALVVALGAAAKAVRFVGAITGINQLVAGYGRLQRLQQAAGVVATSPALAGRLTPALAGGASALMAGTRTSRFGAFLRRPILTRVSGVGTAAGLGIAIGGSLAGDAIGGRTGSILGGAAQGAGLGMLAGPWGAAIGGLVGGIGTAIVDGLRGHAKEEVEQAARAAAADLWRRTESALASGLGRGSARALAARSTRAADLGGDLREHQQRLAELQQRLVRARSAAARGIPGAADAIPDLSGEIKHELAEIARLGPQARTASASVIASLKAGWRGFKLMDAHMIVRDFIDQTRGQTPELKAAAAQTVLEYAHQLERSGQLPRGSVRRIAVGIASEVRYLGPMLGRVTEQSVAAGIDERRITARVQRAVQRASDAFGELPRQIARRARSLPQATASLKGAIDELESREAELRKQAQSGTDAQRAQSKRQADLIETSLGGLRKTYRAALGEIESRYGTSARAADRWLDRTGRAIQRVTEKRSGIETLTGAIGRLELALSGLETVSVPALTAPPVFPSTPQRRRIGGRIRGYQEGGLVPAFVSSGELIEHNGREWMVPGPRVAADNVFTMLPAGAKVFTEDGQALRAAGLPDALALAAQAPHFAAGGVTARSAGTSTTTKGLLHASGHRFTLGELVRLALTVGWSRPNAAIGAATAMGESGGDPRSVNTAGNSPPSRDLGLWQLNDYWNRSDVPKNWQDPLANAIAARRIQQKAGWSDWVVYKQGIYKRWLADAQRIAQTATPLAGGYPRAPAILHRRRVDLLQPYGALDAFQQGFEAAVGGTSRLFRTPAGLDSDLFRAAVAGVRPNKRDLPRIAIGRGPTASPGTWQPGINTLAWSRAFASRFGLTLTSGFRTPAQNAAVNGVRNSMHLDGSPGNPGAQDFVPPSRAALSYARSHGAREALIHDAGSGLHLHVGFFGRGGIARFRTGTNGGARPRPSTSHHRMGPVTAALQAIARAGSGDGADVVRTLRALGELLDETEQITYRRLARLDGAVRGEIRQLARDGLTGVERVQVRRLRAVLTLVEATMGKRLGAVVASAQRVLDIVSENQALVGQVTDPSTSTGLSTQIASDRNSLQALRGERGGLLTALRRARGAHQPEAVRAIEEQLKTVSDTMRDLAIGIAQRTRDLARMKAQEAVNAAQFDVDRGNANVQLLDASQRVTGTAETAGGMRERAAAISSQQPTLQTLIDTLNAQASVALRTNDLDGWRQATLAATQATTDLANVQAEAAELIRAAAMRIPQETLDLADFRASMAQTGYQGLELEQRLNGTYDTVAGGQARANFITAQIIPQIRAQIDAANALVAAAREQYGTESQQYRDALLGLAGLTNSLTQAMIDARDATEANTDQLKEFGGSLTFVRNGQLFTDNINAGVGA